MRAMTLAQREALLEERRYVRRLFFRAAPAELMLERCDLLTAFALWGGNDSDNKVPVPYAPAWRVR